MMRYIYILILLIPTGLFSQDAQWRGPERNGIYPDSMLLRSWPDTGPELLLKVIGIGDGYSSAVEQDGIIYVSGKKDSLDYLSAINQDGQIIWQVPYGKAWDKTYSASRSTPTIEENRIYVVSGKGQLVCIDAHSGKEIWSVDVDGDYGAMYHYFGLAESPLIVDDMVISLPGGEQTTMVALNKFSGEEVWKSESLNGRRSYSSPVLYEYEKIRLILGFTSKDLIAVNPENGQLVWTYPYYLHSVEENVEKLGINLTNVPIFKENEIFITSGYNCPSVMLTLADDGKSVSEKWINPTLDNHHHGVVQIDGYIYGSNFYSNSFGKWVCLDWDTGEVMYLTDWNNKGSIIYADGMFIVYEEKRGYVGLVDSGPKEFKVVSSFQNKEGKGPHWAHPSIYNGRLLLRHGDVLQVFELKK